MTKVRVESRAFVRKNKQTLFWILRIGKIKKNTVINLSPMVSHSREVISILRTKMIIRGTFVHIK